MNFPSFKNIALCSIVLLLPGIPNTMAQTSFQSQVLDMKLSGTSNLHDWDMKASSGSSKAIVAVDAHGRITALSKLSFSLPAKNLKSDHNAMDNNTYKALNADQNPNISFVLTSSRVISKGANNYQFNCVGNMSIAGKTRAVNLIAYANYNPDAKILSVMGVQKMKMTDYSVSPPTAVMGTIKTGDDITISYNVKLN